MCLIFLAVNYLWCSCYFRIVYEYGDDHHGDDHHGYGHHGYDDDEDDHDEDVFGLDLHDSDYHDDHNDHHHVETVYYRPKKKKVYVPVFVRKKEKKKSKMINTQVSKQVAFIKRVSIAHRSTIERVHNTKYVKECSADLRHRPHQ